MFKTTSLWAVLIAVLTSGFFVLEDNYQIRQELEFCKNITKDNCREVQKLNTTTERICFTASLQDIIVSQANRVSMLEGNLNKYTEELAVVRQQSVLLETALETAATQIKTLVDDNSKLQAELDAKTQELKTLNNALLRVKEELADKITEIEKLKKEQP
jgi:chromosome segregation ATPase